MAGRHSKWGGMHGLARAERVRLTRPSSDEALTTPSLSLACLAFQSRLMYSVSDHEQHQRMSTGPGVRARVRVAQRETTAHA